MRLSALHSTATPGRSSSSLWEVLSVWAPTLPDEFLGNHYAYAALGFRRELYRLPQFVGNKIYWGGWYEAGSAFNDPSSVAVRGSANLGIIMETILGPVALDGSVSPTGKTRINFSIGRLF